MPLQLLDGQKEESRVLQEELTVHRELLTAQQREIELLKKSMLTQYVFSFEGGGSPMGSNWVILQIGT